MEGEGGVLRCPSRGRNWNGKRKKRKKYDGSTDVLNFDFQPLELLVVCYFVNVLSWCTWVSHASCANRLIMYRRLVFHGKSIRVIFGKSLLERIWNFQVAGTIMKSKCIIHTPYNICFSFSCSFVEICRVEAVTVSPYVAVFSILNNGVHTYNVPPWQCNVCLSSATSNAMCSCRHFP